MTRLGAKLDGANRKPDERRVMPLSNSIRTIGEVPNA